MDSPVVGVLTPYAKIAPYARTSDGNWLAVSGSDGSAAGWVQAGDVKLPAGMANLPVIYGP
jgi:2-keto-3-deoxy-galactonokinase